MILFRRSGAVEGTVDRAREAIVGAHGPTGAVEPIVTCRSVHGVSQSIRRRGREVTNPSALVQVHGRYQFLFLHSYMPRAPRLSWEWVLLG